MYRPEAMRHEYDPSADALYVRITPGTVTKTLELGDGVLLDLDSHGWVLGIEVISPDRELLRRLQDIQPRSKPPTE